MMAERAWQISRPSPPPRCSNFQAVRFDLEKVLVTRQFPAGMGLCGQCQARGGAGLDFFEQCRHPQER